MGPDYVCKVPSAAQTRVDYHRDSDLTLLSPGLSTDKDLCGVLFFLSEEREMSGICRLTFWFLGSGHVRDISDKTKDIGLIG